jgi:general stress protein 26
VSDPDYCILKFTAEGKGRYYSMLQTEDFEL